MDAYLAATRYPLIEQARNRLALGLLIVFLPVWYFLLAATIAHGPATFRLTATGQFLTVDAYDVTVLAAGANAIALICGFTIFTATRKGAAFDRRLVLCGLPQPLMLAAKLTALAVVAQDIDKQVEPDASVAYLVVGQAYSVRLLLYMVSDRKSVV